MSNEKQDLLNACDSAADIVIADTAPDGDNSGGTDTGGADTIPNHADTGVAVSGADTAPSGADSGGAALLTLTLAVMTRHH